MKWQIEPMTTWPYPKTEVRKSNPFRAKFDATLSLLTDELEHLKVVGAVAVRVVADAADVRLDGMLRARANVRHPGVALSFTSKTVGNLTYPCDTFRGSYHGEVDWQINLRAIALGLEKLRTLDRYGIAGRGEQYAGWRAIEAKTTPPMGEVEAMLTIARLSAELPGEFAASRDLARYREDSNEIVRDYRAAARLHHPDIGGNPAAWAQLDAARRALREAGVIP